jgi:RNA polymerase sigma-70 factor (ECF subfamily)
MSDETDDEVSRDLVGRLGAGDQNALATLYSRERDRLRRIVEFRLDARLRGRVSASDVMQEAYIEALKRLKHYPAGGEVPFFVWMRTVTIQRLIEVHRKHIGAQARAATREVSLGYGGRGDSIDASSEKMAELMGDLTSPSLAAQRGEMIARMRQALDRLEPGDREVLALRHFEELSNREVAAVLGIQAAAASKRYVRAIERLQETMEAFPDQGEEPQ